MNLFDFIRYRVFRIKPSRKYIDSLVEKLLPEQSYKEAERDLKRFGHAAVPSLVVALHDPRFLEIDERTLYKRDQPFEVILDLLVPLSWKDVIQFAKDGLHSPSEYVRKEAAFHLAQLGCDEAVPLLAEYLNDQSGHVRSWVRIGTEYPLSDGRADSGFRQKMYDLLLAQCDQDWGTVNQSAEVVCRLDPQRAAIDFASERWLSPQNPEVHQILKACNEKAIKLPVPLLRRLYEHSLPLAVGERCYPYSYIVGESLIALSASMGDEAKPMLIRALESEEKKIKVSAAEGLAKLAGIDSPVHFVLGRFERSGYRKLTQPQKHVYCSYLFDAEVCNGGLSQFFVNSGCNYISDTSAALHAIGPPQVGQLFDEAIEKIRHLKGQTTAGDLIEAFGPLDNEYYKYNDVHIQKQLLYAIENKEHFR